jgi:hypothetical protein
LDTRCVPLLLDPDCELEAVESLEFGHTPLENRAARVSNVGGDSSTWTLSPSAMTHPAGFRATMVTVTTWLESARDMGSNSPGTSVALEKSVRGVTNPVTALTTAT